MKQQCRNWRFRPVVECLEDRLTPSGNVTASVVNGTLLVSGDGANNRVEIVPGAAPGTVTVEGIAGESPTSVNGVGSATFAASSFANINVKMLGGSDHVRVEVSVPNAVTITTGSGNDFVEVITPTVGTPITANSLSITAASGSSTSDTVIVEGVMVGTVSVATGGGNDFIQVDNSRGPTTFGTLSINSGNGNTKTPFGFGDSIFVSGVTVTGTASLTSGSGNDNVSVFGCTITFGLTINTGNANTAVGSGGDTVTVDKVSVFGNASITTGNGNDNVTMGDTGGGFFSVGNTLTVKTQDGADTVEAANTTAGAGTVDGGKGTDVYKDDGGNFGYSVVNFEGFIF
jgi:hypothetical protein